MDNKMAVKKVDMRVVMKVVWRVGLRVERMAEMKAV
jgi:hypothetical protein